MTNPSQTLHRTTWPGDHDIPARSRAASRSAHPASQPADQPWLWSIASGLASSTSPWTDGENDRPTEARGVVLLSTSAYEVWHVAWPADTPVELSGTLDVQSFCVVEGVLRVVDLSDPGAHGRRYGPGSGTVLTTPRALLIADEPGTSAVHVVLHGGAAGSESLPWNVSGRPTASAA